MKTIHYLTPELMQNTHPITIALIGCGGSGSNLLTQLGRINHTLVELGKPGLQVTVFDPDKVSATNIGRQLFSCAEIGQFKSMAMVSRLNRFFSTGWKAIPEQFDMLTAPQGFNIYISAVDSISSRKKIKQAIDSFYNHQNGVPLPNQSFYWMDAGNTRDKGQVILGTLRNITQPDSSSYDCLSKLSTFFEAFPHMLDANEDHSIPSCSMAQAIRNQDPFINSIVANYAASLIFNLIHQGFTCYNAQFINLNSYRTTATMI